MFSEEYCFTGTTPFYKMKKSSSNFKTVSSVTNLEVFVTAPRCGDYLENTISSASAGYIHVNQSLKSHSNHPNKAVQNYISFTNLKVPKTNATKSRSSYSRDNHINYTAEGNGYKTIKDPMKAENYEALVKNMLAVTVSCVMLMASKAENIPDEYLMWAEYYLTCIKDENKKHPPNVQGILNHIKYLRKNYLLKNHLSRGSDVYSSPLKNPNRNGTTPKSLSAGRLTPVVNYTAKQTQQKILKPIFIKQKTIVNL